MKSGRHGFTLYLVIIIIIIIIIIGIIIIIIIIIIISFLLFCSPKFCSDEFSVPLDGMF